MVKGNVLTPVLSGVLAVTVAGSGVLYVMDKKDADKKDDAKTSSDNTAFARVKDRVEATADKVEKAIKGELDFAYSGKLDIDFGPALTKDFGTELKTISIEASTRQKGGKSQADISASYDGKALATFNIVADNTNKVFYLKCPELNEGYLTGSTEDFAKTLDDYKNNLGSGFGVNMMSVSALGGAGKKVNAESIQQILGQIDFESLTKTLEEYVKVVEDNIPKGTDNGTVDGDIDGHSYSYTVKTIDVTGQVIVDIANAVVDKAKGDQALKDYAVKMGMSENDYSKALDSVQESLTKITGDDLSKNLFSFDVYYLNDDARGFGIDMGDQGVIKMIAIDDGSVLGLDLSANMPKNKVNMSLKGAFENNNDVINGAMNLNLDPGNESQAVKASLSVKDLKTEGEFFSGSVKADIDASGKSIGFSFDSASTSEKLDLTTSLDVNGENAFKVSLTGGATDASDVELPSGTAYNLDEQGVKAYLESCDTDAFMNSLKSTLGEDLVNKLQRNSNTTAHSTTVPDTATQQPKNNIDPDNDFDFNNDFDFDDEDWDDIDWDF